VDEKLKYHFNDKKESIGTQREDGSMDFYNRGLITNVNPGDTLVTIEDSKKGKPGHKVTGEEIPPREPNTVDLPSGKNVKEEDGKLVSEIEGQVVKDGKRVNVLPVHEVKGNVDMDTGNIDFVGNVVVKGDVNEGFKIKAGGNVEINGRVSAAQIESEGKVIIKKGFVGKEKGRIDAKGNVEIKFIENGHIKTEGSIIASDAIMHSDLNAAEDIIVTENKGLLVGGNCQAGHNIEANIIGSTMATKTILEAGVDQETKEELEEVKEELEESEQNLLKTKRAIKALKEIKEKQGKLPTDKEVMYQRLLKTKKVINKSIEKKESKKAELEEILNNVERGKIKVYEKVFSGVKMIIGKSQFNVHEELHHSSFIEENGEIRQIPL
ncbi:MAG TPA: FapA family protein, partial [Halanaerobiales bacterium]|nr:FapA family protein [Halanaerobiales bacterium]